MKDSKEIGKILRNAYEDKLRDVGLKDKKSEPIPFNELPQEEKNLWFGMGRIFSAALQKEHMDGRDKLSAELLAASEPTGESVDYIRAWRDIHQIIRNIALKEK